VYGSLTTIIIGMIWLYFCMYILLTGAQINRYFQPLFIAVDQHRYKKKQHKKEVKRQKKELKKQSRKSSAE
jgi:membrane protein